MVTIFHGTTNLDIQKIKNNGISTSFGGGELGQGFYAGTLEFEAATWAKTKVQNKKYKNATPKILCLTFDENNIRWNPSLNFSNSILYGIKFNREEARTKRSNISDDDKKRTFLFGFDVVFSPIVGTTSIDKNANQYKFESNHSEAFLNNNQLVQQVIK